MIVKFKDGSVVEFPQAKWLYHFDGVTAQLKTSAQGEIIAELLEADIESITLDDEKLPVQSC